MHQKLLRLAGVTGTCVLLALAGGTWGLAGDPRAGASGDQAKPAASKPAAGKPASPARPQASAEVRWTAPASGARIGSALRAGLTVTADQAVRGATVELTVQGPVTVARRSVSLGSIAAGASRRVAVPVRAAGAGVGVVRATVRGRDAAGRPATAVADLHLATAAGRVAVSANGSLEARLVALGFESTRLGRTAYAQRRTALLGGGATSRTVPAALAAPPETTPVSGTIKYTDSAGGTHAARAIRVELIDSDGAADGGTVQMVTTTDSDGKYALEASTLRADGTTKRRLFVRAKAQGVGFVVQSPPAGATPAAVQRIDSAVTEAPGAALTVDITANNTADNNTAFHVADALTTAVQYTRRVNGGATLDALTVNFPDAGGTNFSSATATARILQKDRFDWDVILHEYGHFIDTKFGIQNSPGGAHNLNENLAERLTKDQGIRLAWAEGLATWFAIVAEDALGVRALGIPKVGDSAFDDTEDATISHDLQTVVGVGEDNETSVSAILWHLYKDAKFAIPDTTIISALKAAATVQLSAATPELLKTHRAALFDDSGTPARQQRERTNDVACLYTDQVVSPKLTAPADGFKAKADTPQKFEWEPRGAGPSNRLNSFTVQFWSPNWDKLIFESPVQAATNYTPTAADWKDKIIGGKDASGKLPPTLKVVVKGSGTNAPATGPYKSCAISIAVNHVDMVFAIDTTGSMIPYINSVVAASSAIVDSLATDGVDYRIGVVDYKDVDSDPVAAPGCPPDPYAARTDLPFSTVKADIQAALAALPANTTGGCDLPEDVYSGVEEAIGFPWRDGVKKAIIQLGDAPGHDPEAHSGYTLAQVVADAAAVDPAVVFGILVGPNPDAHTFVQQLATATGGLTFDATGSPAQTGAAVLAAVTELALAPTANAAGPYTGVVGTPVEFDGSGSSAVPPADIASYRWDFGDGSAPVTTSTPTVSHAYTAPLTGTVTLTVTDSNGKTGVSTAAVTIARPRPPLAIDTEVSADDGRTPTLTAPPLTTAGPDELVAVFISADGPQGSVQQVSSVTGGGLTFQRASAATAQPGVAEVWTANATAPLSGVRIAAQLTRSGWNGSITVVALTGARSTIGAVARASGRGNASAALTTTSADSLLLAVGHDWSQAVTPTLPAGQAFVHLFLDAGPGDTSWVQRVSGLGPAAGSSVTFQATLRPNDRWNLAGLEVVPAG